MDELTESIGKLSTNAKEWKPPSQRQHQHQQRHGAPQSPVPSTTQQRAMLAAHHQSPVRSPGGAWKPAAAGRKEFVPGAGWPTTTTTGRSTSGDGALPSSSMMTATSKSWEPPARQSADSPAETELLFANKAQESTVPAGPAPPPPPKSLSTLGGGGGGDGEVLWLYHRDVSLESQREMDPADPRHKAVPPPFSNAFQLDETTTQASSSRRSSFGYPTLVFKVINREDGRLYCLRRCDNVKTVSHKIAAAVTERWLNATTTTHQSTAHHHHHYLMEHSGLVRFYRVFLYNRAVFFVHDFVPGARTMRERFFLAPHGSSLPEPVIWSCVVQLVSAIRAVHAAGLACRSLQANHILCQTLPGGGDAVATTTGRAAIRLSINCLAMVDALEFESRKPLRDLHREDMHDLGRLVLSMATGAEITRTNSGDPSTMQRCDAFVRKNYSPELFHLAFSLLSVKTPSILEVSRAVTDHAFDEINASQTYSLNTEAALASEYESARALRLLLKLGFVNERPEFGMNRRWTESGDCYVLKLFRDYVFHQADGAGNPVMDLGHVVTALNKLDAMDEEKIVLSSRDGKTLMVVTFADVARCLNNAFAELCSGAVPPGALQY